jgi:outer membrane protein assembly factor BamA
VTILALPVWLAAITAIGQTIGTRHAALGVPGGLDGPRVPGAPCLVPTAEGPPTSVRRLVPGTQAVQSPPASPQEVLAEIRVHGNLIVSNDEVIAIAGVRPGDPISGRTTDDVAARLRASKKFQDVQVLKRFASISDPTQIALVIVVNEGPVRIESGTPGRPLTIVRRRGIRNLMFLPIIDAEDGYGVTYGARLAILNTAGPKSRLSFPLTWGGMKHAGIELERRFGSGLFSRVELGGAVQRQTNPAFHQDDDRQRVWARAERTRGPLRAGGTVGWQHVSFAGTDDQFRSVGGDITLDTRIDPQLPRNAVYAVASWERVSFPVGDAVNRSRLEARGYLGLVGPVVLALRAVREDANRPLPPYLKSLLGGWSSLRGFQAGSFVGDSLLAGSAELRLPLSSSLRIAKVGISVFADAGAAYDHGQHYGDQPVHQSLGGSIWLAATLFHLEISVAHGRGAGTRANFGAGLSF